MRKRNKLGKFTKELDHAVMIKFFADYEEKEKARERLLKGESLSQKCRELFRKWLYGKKNR